MSDVLGPDEQKTPPPWAQFHVPLANKEDKPPTKKRNIEALSSSSSSSYSSSSSFSFSSVSATDVADGGESNIVIF